MSEGLKNAAALREVTKNLREAYQLLENPNPAVAGNGRALLGSCLDVLAGEVTPAVEQDEKSVDELRQLLNRGGLEFHPLGTARRYRAAILKAQKIISAIIREEAERMQDGEPVPLPPPLVARLHELSEAASALLDAMGTEFRAPEPDPFITAAAEMRDRAMGVIPREAISGGSVDDPPAAPALTPAQRAGELMHRAAAFITALTVTLDDQEQLPQKKRSPWTWETELNLLGRDRAELITLGNHLMSEAGVIDVFAATRALREQGTNAIADVKQQIGDAEDSLSRALELVDLTLSTELTLQLGLERYGWTSDRREQLRTAISRDLLRIRELGAGVAEDAPAAAEEGGR